MTKYSPHDAITFAIRDEHDDLWSSADDLAALAINALDANGYAIVSKSAVTVVSTAQMQHMLADDD